MNDAKSPVKYTPKLRQAPPLQVQQWLNVESAEDAKRPLELAQLRGKIVVIEAFQMLCPGCVQFGLPQAQRIAAQFDSSEVVVLGLHTVFEQHEAMTPAALAEFIREHQLDFPIGVDTPDGASGIPLTMRAYTMQGTPTLIMIDQAGRLRLQKFGHVSDQYVWAAIASLMNEAALPQNEEGARAENENTGAEVKCDDGKCGSGPGN